MNTSHVVFLVLTMSSVWRVNSLRSKGPRTEYPAEDQCKRMGFIDRGELTDLLQQLQPNTDMESVLEILGKSINQAIRFCSKSYVPIDDFEVVGGSSYMCAGEGMVVNLYSLTAVSWNYLGEKTPRKDQPLEFKITFQNKGWVTLEYYHPFVKIPMTHLNGRLYANVNDISVDLTISSDSLTTMVEKLRKQECFLHIKNFEASLFVEGDSMDCPDHERKYELVKIKVSAMFHSKVEEIEIGLKQKIKASFYEGLVNSGGWVCLDDHVKEVIDKKLTSYRKEITSEAFKQSCKN